jgi:hypothetical protein
MCGVKQTSGSALKMVVNSNRRGKLTELALARHRLRGARATLLLEMEGAERRAASATPIFLLS